VRVSLQLKHQVGARSFWVLALLRCMWVLALLRCMWMMPVLAVGAARVHMHGTATAIGSLS
jgi:hypothetical protein